MTLLELQPKLQQAVANGQIGSPVALRVYLKSSDTDADLQSGGVTAIGMARELFDSPPARLMVRGDLQRQATVLVTCVSGATLFATLEGGTVESSSIHLTLIGNHGIANLEKVDWSPAALPEESPASIRWRQALSESHASGTAVVIPQGEA
ncbi:hypothetical protein CA54_01440 [Symmachiella macrocystis]|uniref:Uncharacterized protein n=1 Tax=Symmachiella macrocystis TaxID=2527985 RepID=A0A5C6BI08_9PLAN|nr:hypothetical protein [Symmachiella macrocystis]TWU11337.1 hypothetical protein CA54_01440 [Symmachiella macrocystis]